MGDPQKSEDRREIPPDVIPNLLLRLPTNDFVRSSCVCKLWRSIVADPSFRKLHVAHHAAAAASSEPPEVLLLTRTSEHGSRSDELSAFNLSSAKALSSHVAIPSKYHLAGVCNDWLCFAHDHDQARVVVCNPVTGDTLQLPKAPPLPTDPQLSHLFVLGLSTPTKEYKMFRLSFPRRHDSSRDETNYMAVYTLGAGAGGGGWRQSSYLSRFHPLRCPAPVHTAGGNIFVPTADLADKRARAARMLVVDVATETPRSYPIPYNYADYHQAWDHMMADSFDLNGQMSLVVYVFGNSSSRVKIQFWVMKPPADEIEGKDEEEDDDDDYKLYWDLRYSFFFDDPFYVARPRGVWIDHAHTLCFRLGNSVYKYDTRRGCPPSSSSSSCVDSLLFDKRLDLPDASSCSSEFCHWSICGGYRPSHLSPLIFALPPPASKGRKRPQLERTLLRALMAKS